MARSGPGLGSLALRAQLVLLARVHQRERAASTVSGMSKRRSSAAVTTSVAKMQFC